ncbi:MAG TPA: hypothetical protein PKD23_03875 [Bellilinea sp.]|jgi:hypothetical protein|nr:hypothetical protein [Bellilinea sp.]
MTSTYPPDSALILVAVIPEPRDLEIARVLGWYRIPLRRAPKVVDVDYLAFYQTAAYGEEDRWQISSVAAVRGVELTTRGELLRDEADHPRAREEYYKIQIGALQRLPQPILANAWRRVTFLYTTGEILRQARTINDLVVKNEDRSLLWQSLRERALSGSNPYSDELPADFEDMDALMLAMLGDFRLFKEGAESFSASDD